MADSEDEERLHPWVRNPRRMRDDLKQTAYAFDERLQKKLPSVFTTEHGLLVQETMKKVVAGLDEPERLKSLVAPVDSSPSSSPSSRGRGARPETERLQSSLAQVQAERDALVRSVDVAKASSTALLQQLAERDATIAKLQRECDVVGRRPPSPAIAEVAMLREKAHGLEGQTAILRQEKEAIAIELRETALQLDEYATHGSPELFAAYCALGTPDEVQGRLVRLRALARVAVLAVRSANEAAASTGAALGSFLLEYARRGRLLQQIFNAASGSPSSSEVRQPLASLLADLSSSSPSATSVDDALAQLTSSSVGSEVDRTGVSDFGCGDLSVFEQLNVDVTAPLLADGDIHRLLTNESAPPDLQTAYQLALTRAAAPRSSPNRSGRRPKSAVAHAAPAPMSPDAAVSGGAELIDLSSPQSPSVHLVAGESGTPWRDVALHTPASSSDHGALSSSSVKSFQDERENCRKLLAGLRQSITSPAWPFGEPVTAMNPTSVRDLRMTPWRLDLFLFERLTPGSPASCNACLTVASDDVRRFVSLKEVNSVYRHRPWRILYQPPDPVTFMPADPRFRAFYLNARRVYELGAQVFWERAHYILVEPGRSPGASGKATAAETARSDWNTARRRRNSDFKKYWIGHLQLIMDLFKRGVVDADFLLDPFLLWPPAYGVALVMPPAAKSLAQYINEVDASQPERLFFCTPEVRAEHVSQRKLQFRSGSTTRVFDRIVRKFVPDELFTSFRRPSSPLPIVAKRRSVTDQFHSDDESDDADRYATTYASSHVSSGEEEGADDSTSGNEADADAGDEPSDAENGASNRKRRQADDSSSSAADRPVSKRRSVVGGRPDAVGITASRVNVSAAAEASSARVETSTNSNTNAAPVPAQTAPLSSARGTNHRRDKPTLPAVSSSAVP